MIEQITIRNFKSLGDVTVDLVPTTVLIGRSGVGKSNFFRAIRFLRNFLINNAGAVNDEGGWQRIHPFGSPSPLSFDLKFRLPGFDEPFAYRLAWKVSLPQNAILLVEEALDYGTNQIFRNLSNGPHQQIQVQLGSLPTKTEAVLSFAALTGGIGWHDFPASVFTHPQAQGVASKGLDDSAGNYLSVLKDLTQDLRDQNARRQIVARLRQINPSIGSVELNSIITPQKVIVGHRLGDSSASLELSQESDGFRRYLAHLLAIYQTPPKQLLMFEEPENGISPGALKSLSEEFSDAPERNRGQILLATQSPDLLDGFDPDQIRVVDLDPKTQLTKIGPLDSAQIEAVRDQLLTPGELLTVDQARRKAQEAITS
jgi:predicted ATPase